MKNSHDGIDFNNKHIIVSELTQKQQFRNGGDDI